MSLALFKWASYYGQVEVVKLLLADSRINHSLKDILNYVNPELLLLISNILK